MFKKFAQRSALVLSLTFLAAPVSGIFAQAPAPVVTGGDPMPSGDNVMTSGMLLMLASVATAS